MAQPRGHYQFPEDINDTVDELARAEGSYAALARKWSITKQFLDLMRSGRALWRERFLREMGWERVTIYRRIEK